MREPPRQASPEPINFNLLLAYLADLELEVDHLRRRGRFVRLEVRETLKRLAELCAHDPQAGDAPARLYEVARTAGRLEAVLRDVQQAPGYRPAHDQVTPIAVRPLVEQVFRCQQRLAGAPEAVLRVDLESEHMEWFPARLRHILDNLLSNALKYRDPDKAEAWVAVGLRESPDAYELRVSDNGVGLRSRRGAEVFDLFYRAAPVRAAAGLGVGLPVVKLLVERSGGSLTADSGEGQGTSITATLPRYDLDDFLL
jgi:signal transduction histidine kinase